MIEKLKYVPIFRARQQEIALLKEFEFGEFISPMVEIIKEKDRKNNQLSSSSIYQELINEINADKVFLSLPTYIKISSSTHSDVITFSRKVLENIDSRISFLKQFSSLDKVIPVISSLLAKTGEINTITKQFEALKDDFEVLAYQTFPSTFEQDFQEIQNCLREKVDVFFYDLDNVNITSPVFKKQKSKIALINPDGNRILCRSAINKDIQNVTLVHEEIIDDADNSLVEMYEGQGFNGFGDYVGIKKDELTAGGTISPGFILYDPADNLYYGFKGNLKKLEEFEITIVPAVFNSHVVKNLQEKEPQYLNNNPGFITLRAISEEKESGKNQAKFKKVSMGHYLHCIKTSLEEGRKIPLV